VQGQRDGSARRGVALGVLQQVAQRGDSQQRRHRQRRVRQFCRELQQDWRAVTATGVLNRQPRDLGSRALQAIVEIQTAFHPGQQQQLFERALQAVGAGLGVGQGLFGSGAFGHACHLQVGLDRRQRAAQFVPVSRRSRSMAWAMRWNS